MWLLDGNVDVHVAQFLIERGVACETAKQRGWKALTNGQLIAAAVAGGFDCLLTRDRLFQESAARALRQHPLFAIVLITLRQQRWREYLLEMTRAWDASPIQPAPGQFTEWPAPMTGESGQRNN